MGSEIYCQLCGVAFNTSRIRTRQEPRDAAWLSVAADGNLTWVGSNARDYDPCDDDCVVLHRRREIRDSGEEGPELFHQSWENLTSDPIFPAGGELSWSSHAPEQGLGQTEDSIRKTERSAYNSPAWSDSPDRSSTHLDTEFQPLSVVEDLDDGEIGLKALDDLRRGYEHIAGPSCEYLEGYNGNYISVGEMRGSSTVQCLVRKVDGWEPLDDDQDFEAYSSCCLTGLTRGLDPIWSNRFSPVRHGTSEWVSAANESDNTLRSAEMAIWIGLPFHPTCFELFRRASSQALGRVATEELMNLRDDYCKYPEYLTEPFCQRNDDVINSFQEGTWRPSRGTEYLVADPIFIPVFKQICDAARRVPIDFSVQESPFLGQPVLAKSSSEDPFLKLPSEILQAITGYLGSKNIASLRLSSRAFQHLPISVWYRLLVEELPFIYEAWSDDPYPYKWALIDAARFQKLTNRGEAYDKERKRTLETLRSGQPEILEAWLKDSPTAKPWNDTLECQNMMDWCTEENQALQPVHLPYDKTNWYQLYCEIVKNWKHLKGLQNRQRIWSDVTKIISRMMEHAEAHPEEELEEEIL